MSYCILFSWNTCCSLNELTRHIRLALRAAANMPCQFIERTTGISRKHNAIKHLFFHCHCLCFVISHFSTTNGINVQKSIVFSLILQGVLKIEYVSLLKVVANEYVNPSRGLKNWIRVFIRSHVTPFGPITKQRQWQWKNNSLYYPTELEVFPWNFQNFNFHLFFHFRQK